MAREADPNERYSGERPDPVAQRYGVSVELPERRSVDDEPPNTSILEVLLRPVEFALPPTPPVAAIPVIAANLLRYLILVRIPNGRELVQQWGERKRSREAQSQY